MVGAVVTFVLRIELVMRIAFFTETFLPKIDGIVTVTCLLLDHLERRGIETVIVAPWNGVQEYRQTRVIGVPSVTMPLYPEVKFGPPTWNTYRAIKQFQPDVIHCISPALVGGGGLLIARQLGIPTVASFHLDLNRLVHHFGIGLIEPFTRWFTRTVYNMADHALAPSRVILDELMSIGVDPVTLWRRGVDAEQFHPCYRDEAMRRQLTDGHPEDHLLLYVGRLSTEKRLEDILAVLEMIPHTRLALIGDGPARRSLEHFYAGKPVVFSGYLQGENLARAYASADVFVFPSALETFGLVVMEAMAAGLPVVAARIGGVPEVIHEGETGYIFPVGDVAGLVAGVQQTLADPVRRLQMGTAARAYAETLSWESMMDEVVDLYVRLRRSPR